MSNLSFSHKLSRKRYKCKRLIIQIDELLGEVNEFNWACYGKTQWVVNKLNFAPHLINIENLTVLQQLLDRLPVEATLTGCLKKLEKQPESVQLQQNEQARGGRILELTKAIQVVEEKKILLNRLVEKVDSLLVDRRTEMEKIPKQIKSVVN